VCECVDEPVLVKEFGRCVCTCAVWCVYV